MIVGGLRRQRHRPGVVAEPARHRTEAVAQIGTRTLSRCDAALAPATERAELWRRLEEMYPYFTGYQQRTTRAIPVVILTPAR